MGKTKIQCFYPSARFSWLPAIALYFSLSASPQAQVGLAEGYLADKGSAATAATAGTPTAAATSEQAPKLTPEQMGDRLAASLRYQAALQAYAQVAQPSAALWNKIGVSYQMLGDLKDAVRCYKASLKLRPANPSVLNNLGTVHDLLGNLPAAERDYRKAIKLNPDDAKALSNLGTNLLNQREYKKGAEAYQQALAINPHVLDAGFGIHQDEPSDKQALGAANYFKARSCAQAGLTDCALTYLEMAFAEGFATVKSVAADADFASLRGTPALARLLAQQP
jgi:tetratricopeptide (TPR) repeat protein